MCWVMLVGVVMIIVIVFMVFFGVGCLVCLFSLLVCCIDELCLGVLG